MTMKIIVDAFGGDNAPLEMIKGAKMAQQEYGVQVRTGQHCSVCKGKRTGYLGHRDYRC